MSGSFVCDKCGIVFYYICDPDDPIIDRVNPITATTEILCDQCRADEETPMRVDNDDADIPKEDKNKKRPPKEA